MRVEHLTVSGFRGFNEIEIRPTGHVLLVGEPRAGRSDLLAAIELVLEVDGPRALSEFDFHGQDLGREVTVEVTMTDLTIELQQRFLDEIELWDSSTRQLVPIIEGPSALPATATPAIRLGYRARWDPEEQGAVQYRYWVKDSNPSSDQFRRVTREERAAIPFLSLAGRRPLNLAPRGGLRALIHERGGTAELAEALDTVNVGIEQIATKLATTPPVSNTLVEVVELLRDQLALSGAAEDVVRLLPEGGSLAALLRGLIPALDLDDGAGHLPLLRHGSSTFAAVARLPNSSPKAAPPERWSSSTTSGTRWTDRAPSVCRRSSVARSDNFGCPPAAPKLHGVSI